SKQGDLVDGVVPADRRRRPERLDKVTKGAQLDDKDLAPLRQRNGIATARPKFRESFEIDEARELLEGIKHSGMPVRFCRADARQQARDDARRRPERRRSMWARGDLRAGRQPDRGGEKG